MGSTLRTSCWQFPKTLATNSTTFYKRMKTLITSWGFIYSYMSSIKSILGCCDLTLTTHQTTVSGIIFWISLWLYLWASHFCRNGPRVHCRTIYVMKIKGINKAMVEWPHFTWELPFQQHACQILLLLSKMWLPLPCHHFESKKGLARNPWHQ